MEREVLNSIDVIVESLTKEQYKLSDIGLATKVAFDWEKAGLYPKARRSKFRRKYNGLEYVWLRMVNELRGFGLSHSAILQLKDFLFQENDLTSFISDNVLSELEQDEMLNKEVRKLFKSKQKLEEEIREADIALLNTTFGILLFSVVLTGIETHLLIKKSGECLVYDDPMKDRFSSSLSMNEPYISYPLKHALSELIGREYLYELEDIEDFMSLSDGEQKVLELIRTGDVKTLTVRFIDNEIRLIELEQTIDLKEAKGKLVDLIRQGGYEEISYKTQDGNIVAVNKKTKHKV